MENIVYKKLVQIDDQNLIIAATTSDFASGEDWHEVGEQDSRHYHLDLINNFGNYKYELLDGEISERDTSAEDDAAELKAQRQEINKRTDATIAEGAPFNGKMIPCTDEWESKYLALVKKKDDGGTFEIELDTVDNKNTFIVTDKNIEELTDAVAGFKIGTIVAAQIEKRSL